MRITGIIAAALLSAWTPVAAAAGAAPAATPAPAGGSAGGWSFEFTPYLWGAGIDGQVKVGRLSATGVEADFSDILHVLDVAFMGAFEANRGRFGILVDTVYVDTSETVPTPQALFGDARVDVTQTIYTLAAQFRIRDEKNVSVAFIGGLRYGSVDAGLELTSGVAAGRTAGDSIDWWDVVMGARLSWAFAPKWSLVGHADFGGGGTRLSWQALAGVDWEFSPHLAGKFGYRYLAQDYDKDNVMYDVAIAGPYAGLGIRF